MVPWFSKDKKLICAKVEKIIDLLSHNHDFVVQRVDVFPWKKLYTPRKAFTQWAKSPKKGVRFYFCTKNTLLQTAFGDFAH